jgi:hypothetical protein
VSGRDVQVELLIGRRAYDVDGRLVGRIEELLVEPRDGEHVVTEYHLGAAAFLERLAMSARQLRFLRLLPRAERIEYRVRWDQMDLSDPARPRVTVPRATLARGAPED